MKSTFSASAPRRTALLKSKVALMLEGNGSAGELQITTRTRANPETITLEQLRECQAKTGRPMEFECLRADGTRGSMRIETDLFVSDEIQGLEFRSLHRLWHEGPCSNKILEVGELQLERCNVC